MRHVALVAHESLATIVAPEREVTCMASLVTNQLVPIAELFLAKVTRVPEQIVCQNTVKFY